MKETVKLLLGFAMFVWWLLGVVIAQGFWSTLFSVINPFWSWYLFAEFMFIQIFSTN